MIGNLFSSCNDSKKVIAFRGDFGFLYSLTAKVLNRELLIILPIEKAEANLGFFNQPKLNYVFFLFVITLLKPLPPVIFCLNQLFYELSNCNFSVFTFQNYFVFWNANRQNSTVIFCVNFICQNRFWKRKRS